MAQYILGFAAWKLANSPTAAVITLGSLLDTSEFIFLPFCSLSVVFKLPIIYEKNILFSFPASYQIISLFFYSFRTDDL